MHILVFNFSVFLNSKVFYSVYFFFLSRPFHSCVNLVFFRKKKFCTKVCIEVCEGFLNIIFLKLFFLKKNTFIETAPKVFFIFCIPSSFSNFVLGSPFEYFSVFNFCCCKAGTMTLLFFIIQIYSSFKAATFKWNSCFIHFLTKFFFPFCLFFDINFIQSQF